VVPQITSVAVAIRGADGMPFAALTVSGPFEQLPKERADETIRAIEEEVRAIEPKARTLLAELGF